MGFVPLCLLGTLAWFPGIINADPYSNQPKLMTEDGNLIIMTASDKNITFRTSGRGYVNLNENNLLHVTQMAQQAAASVSRFQQNLESNIQGRLDLLTRQISGPRSLSTKLALLEQVVYRGNLSSETSLSAPSRTVNTRLNRQANRIRRIEIQLRRLQSLLTVDECLSNPCRNGGTCQDLFNNFICICPTNWQGTLCDVDVNECAMFSGTDLGCQNGATCINKQGTYECLCPDTFFGLHCTLRTNDCSSANSARLCGNGVCVNQGGTGRGYSCICNEGWTTDASQSCTVDVDECQAKRYPCSHDPYVTCINLPGSYHCGFCPPGYIGNGFQCADIDECKTNNGGCSEVPKVPCINTMGSRVCGACPAGFSGDGVICSPVIGGACTVNNGGCFPTAHCFLTGGIINCQCPDGYTGSGYGPAGCSRSDLAVHPCHSSPCRNGGTCVAVGATYSCVCHPHTTGRDCSQPVYASCDPNPCQNNGQCSIIVDNGLSLTRCTCTPGYEGLRCEFASSGCGGSYYQDSGELEMPIKNTAQQYSNGQHCTWHIEVFHSKVVDVNITELSIDSSENCQANHLTLEDPAPLGSTHSFCTSSDSFPKIRTTSNKLTVTYHATTGLNINRFKLSWTAANPSCGGEVEATTHGTIESPLHPQNYPANLDCEWKIYAPPGKKIQLLFNSLDLQPSTDCSKDYLKVQEYERHEPGPLLAVYCNSSNPNPVTTNLPAAYILFHSDASGGAKGFKIMYTLVEGCGGVLTSTSGDISPPMHDDEYQDDLDCEWKIQLPVGDRIKIVFNKFDLEETEPCDDYLQVRDGPSAMSPIVGLWCGSTLPPPFTSSSNILTIIFHSDFLLGGTGFLIHYETLCGGEFTSLTGEIRSPNYPLPYYSDRECFYLIATPPSTAIQLHFQDFDTEYIDKDCDFDYLEVHDGDNANATLIGQRYCGTNRPGDIISTHNYLYLVFTTDRSFTYRGFLANYSTIDLPCGGILKQTTGTFSAPMSEDGYLPEAKCKWVISAEPGWIIQLSWLSFHLEYSRDCVMDAVEVYENNTSTGKSQLTEKYCGLRIPPPTTSSTNMMTVVFRSDDSVHREGFTAHYVMVDKRKVCGGTYRTITGTFESPNYPNQYLDNKECTWIIHVPQGQQIRLTFELFHLENNSKSCSYDSLIIRNGLHETSPLIGKYCGSNTPPDVTSFTNGLWIHFSSDRSVNDKGFRASWDATSTGCGGTLTGVTGSIMSPNYPQPYKQYAECYFKISVSLGSKVRLSFIDLDLESHSRCSLDYIEVYDGLDDRSPSLGKFCTSEQYPPSLMATTNHMFVKFVSDISYSGRGFHLKYHSECNVTLTSRYGSIESPNYPNNYSPNLNCMWVIQAPLGNKLNITIDHFELEENNPFEPENTSAQICDTDYLEISQSSLEDKTPTQQLSKICGVDPGPGKFSTSMEKAYIHFVTDFMLERPGFRLEWAVVGCGGVFRKPRGSFSSPNYPNSYPRKIMCEWQIIAPWDQSIEITLHNIQMEDISSCHFDFFAIYAGEDDTAPLLIKACHDQTSPQVFSTSGNHAFVRFHSDHSMTGKGFLASWKFVDAKCGGRFTAPFGAIYSHNYPKNYDNHDDCEWLIQVPTNHLVNLTFTDFDLELSTENMTTDYVNVYDGPTVKSPLLLTHSGNQLPQPAYVISSGNTILVRHKADGSYTAKGFSAHYTLACGARISANGTGTFSLTSVVSAESPWAKDDDVNCTWYIIAENPADKISLTFTLLDVSPTEENVENDCSYNYVAVHDGDSINSTIVSRVCGTKVPPTLRSSGSALTVHVASMTNFRSHLGRFTALYSTYSTACGGELVSEQGSFASPNYPDGYPADADCEWQMKASPGNKVTLSFVSFELEQSEHCNTDYVEVRSGKSNGTLLGVFCGSDLPNNITAHNAIWLRFRSDASNTAPGFMADYSLVHGSELAGDSGQLASPLYPHSFVQHGDYTWTITVSTNKVVRITFTQFYMDQFDISECQSAFLKIFDGPSAEGSSAPLLTVCGASLPEPVISHGNTVTIVFHNQPYIHGSSFLMNWEAVSPDRAIPTTVTNTSVETSLGCGKLIHLSPVVGNHSVVITSPNYPQSYENDLKCVWIIDTSVGFHLQLKFTAFDLETYDDCELDYVVVYAEAETETTGWKALSGNLCLPTTTGMNFVAGNHMKITFDTDESLKKPGFSAVVTAVCGGTITSLSGSLNLTGLPVNVTINKVVCEWVFTVRSSRTIQFKLSNFNLKQRQDSCGDSYIMLRNGGYNDSPPLGNARYCEGTEPVILQSSSNRVFVSYSAMTSSQGVFIEYEEMDFDCKHDIVLGNNMRSKIISSPNYPEVPSTSHITCTWSVTVPPGESVQIDFTDRFDLKYSRGCAIEYLEIYDGGTELSPLIERYCTTTPDTIRSHGNHMFIKYFTDAETPNNGFRATVSIASCGGTYFDVFTPITLRSPKYPDNYPPKQDCVWRIVGYSDDVQLEVEVTELFLRGENETCYSTSDFIEFVNVDLVTRNMTDEPPPTKLCGQRPASINASELVPPSSSNEMYIRFHSGQRTDEFGDKRFALTIRTKRQLCQTELNAPSGVITSQGYPTPVPRRTFMYCRWLITVPEGRRISLKFVDFDPEPMRHDREFKIMMFSEGQFIRGLSKSSDNYTLPIESTLNEMRIIYTEESISGAHRGFKAEFSSDNPILCGGVLEDSGMVGFTALGKNLENYICKWTHTQDLKAANQSTFTITINGTFSVPRNASHATCNYYLSPYDSVLITDTSTLLRVMALICQDTPMPYVLRTSNPTVKIVARKATNFYKADAAFKSIANFTIVYKTDPCGGTVRGPQAVITSPGFPTQYPPNTDCSWTVKFQEGATIRVRFEQLDMGPDCNNNFLLLYNGDTQIKPHLTQPLCGNKAPSLLITQTNVMLVEFHSGILNSESHSGFKILLEEESSGCGGILHSDFGAVKSPNYGTKDYPNNVECEWKVVLSPGFHAAITFKDRFSLETSAGCTNDFIQIFDWVNSTWVQIGGNICGREPPTNITSKTNQFRVLFRTSSSITSDGFMLSWENRCGGTFEVEGDGIIISPKYPKEYPPSMHCTYTLLAPSKTIYGKFEDFAVEEAQDGPGDPCRYDNVTIATNSLAPQFRFSFTQLMFRFSQSKTRTVCGYQIPEPVFSYGSLDLTFKTDRYIGRKGFLFKYSVANCGTNITAPTTISNPNNSQLRNCTWFITAPEDKIVSVRLTTERMFIPFCGLKIYDGHNISNATSLIVSVCSSFTTKRSRYTSTGNKMAVQYQDPRYRPMQFTMHISFTYGEKQNCGGTIRMADVVLPYTLRSVDVNRDGKYESQLSCDWLLLAPESHQIYLTFNKLDLQNCSGCECDFLEIHDGDHNGMPQIGRFCGSNVSSIPNIISSSGSLLVHFSSDGATQLSGFQLTATTRLSSCGEALKNASRDIQILQSPGYPDRISGNSQLCRWFVFSPGQNSGLLSLHITDLDLPSPCANNYLEISEMWTMSRFLLGRDATPWDSQTVGQPLKVCGNRTTELIFLGHNAQIRFVSSSFTSHRGFKMEYRMKGCSDNYTQPNGRLTFNHVYFKDGDSCYNRIQAPNANFTIALYFNSFICFENDRLPNKMMIFDGSSDQAEEIGSFCSTRRPNPVFSTGPALFIKWQAIQFLGRYDITYTTTDKGRGCGGRFSNIAGIFSSPLYPSAYKKDSVCRWDVTVPHGNKIIFKFRFFDIGPSHTCTTNYIKFFDVNTSTGGETAHSQFCGKETPADVQMNGDTAYVQYKTSTQNNGTGWVLQWLSAPNTNFV